MNKLLMIMPTITTMAEANAAEMADKAVDILSTIVIVGGLVVLIVGLIQFFSSFGSQNSDAKSHSALVIAAALGIIAVGKVLIPMIGSIISPLVS